MLVLVSLPEQTDPTNGTNPKSVDETNTSIWETWISADEMGDHRMLPKQNQAPLVIGTEPVDLYHGRGSKLQPKSGRGILLSVSFC